MNKVTKRVFENINLVEEINEYLSDKQLDTLPSSPRLREESMNAVITLCITLINNNRFDILSKLELPDYVKPQIKLVKDMFLSGSNKKYSTRTKYSNLFFIFGTNKDNVNAGRSSFRYYFLRRLLGIEMKKITKKDSVRSDKKILVKKQMMDEVLSYENLAEKLNKYLSDKQVNNLPNLPKKRIGMINTIKAMTMMLIKCRRYDVLTKLNLPEEINSKVEIAINNTRSQLVEKIAGKIRYNNLLSIFDININQFDKGRQNFVRDFILMDNIKPPEKN